MDFVESEILSPWFLPHFYPLLAKCCSSGSHSLCEQTIETQSLHQMSNDRSFSLPQDKWMCLIHLHLTRMSVLKCHHHWGTPCRRNRLHQNQVTPIGRIWNRTAIFEIAIYASAKQTLDSESGSSHACESVGNEAFWSFQCDSPLPLLCLHGNALLTLVDYQFGIAGGKVCLVFKRLKRADWTPQSLIQSLYPSTRFLLGCAYLPPFIPDQRSLPHQSICPSRTHALIHSQNFQFSCIIHLLERPWEESNY